MRIFGLGMPELIVVLIVVLILFGPKNLPKLGNAFGKTVKSLREGLGANEKKAEADEQVDQDTDELIVESAKEKPAPKARVKKAEEEQA